MAEHWCKEHAQLWFKKGKMIGYAHPILDENGDPIVGKWCNEPKGDEEPPQSEVESTTKPMAEKQGDNKNKSYALSYAKDLVVAGKVEVDAIISWATVFDKYLSGDFIESETDIMTKFVTKYGKKKKE